MAPNNRTHAGSMALGGVLAALAVVIMSMGTLIPVATYVCPVLCTLILEIVRKCCGSTVAWGWYGCVALLSILLAPDKEAGIIFVFLGYYPILKRRIDRLWLAWLWKLLFFNTVILVAYWLMINLLGMDAVITEFQEIGTVFLIVLLILGNITFLMLDRLLGMRPRRRR